MDGTRRVIFFILLVTLSSVIGQDFSFKKKDYLEIVKHQGELDNFYDHRSTPIRFYNTDVLTGWVINKIIEKNKKKEEEGGKEGIYLMPKKNNKESLPYIVLINKDTYELKREHLDSMSLYFDIVEDKRDATVYGTLNICFKDNEKETHGSCFTAKLFSPPKTKEDIHFANDITETINPFTIFAMQRIANKEMFKWKLSSLEKVLKGVIKKIVTQKKIHENFITIYVLRTIIVDEKHIAKYFSVANPNRAVKCMRPKQESTSTSRENEAGGDSSGAAQQGEESVEEEQKECVEEKEQETVEEEENEEEYVKEKKKKKGKSRGKGKAKKEKGEKE